MFRKVKARTLAIAMAIGLAAILGAAMPAQAGICCRLLTTAITATAGSEAPPAFPGPSGSNIVLGATNCYTGRGGGGITQWIEVTPPSVSGGANLPLRATWTAQVQWSLDEINWKDLSSPGGRFTQTRSAMSAGTSLVINFDTQRIPMGLQTRNIAFRTVTRFAFSNGTSAPAEAGKGYIDQAHQTWIENPWSTSSGTYWQWKLASNTNCLLPKVA